MNRKLNMLLFTILMLLIDSSYASWETSTSKDKMTEEKISYANSSLTVTTEKMGFPYSDVKAWLGVGCDGTDEWAYVGFNRAPNLSNTDTKDGYSLINTRIKWDNNLDYVNFSQDWGAKFIHFRNEKSAISGIIESNFVLLELDWHGQGKTYFKFSLKGSSTALKAIRSSCAKY